MRDFNSILIALALTTLLGGCSSHAPKSERTAAPTETQTDSEDGEMAEPADGARVCGWSDTGRWVCSGGSKKKKKP